MLSKNQIKHIASLQMKKFRDEHQQFVAEGHKIVMELAGSRFKITGIYGSKAWISENALLLPDKNIPLFETGEAEMQRITALSTPSPVLAVVQIPDHAEIRKTSGWGLALDDIRDPGNMGTIIRIADWFGMDFILCSRNCVDLFNPKVVQATMGSIARTSLYSCDLPGELKRLAAAGMPVFGAFLEGRSIYETESPESGIILIGNESRGISADLKPFVTKKIFIPAYGSAYGGKAESLNASVAAAIICAEFRRKSSQ